MLNLHPALPGGPKGMWQQVIWELLEDEADETGAMIHLATAQLDRGPVVSTFRFSLARPRLGPALEAVPRQAQDDERGGDRRRRGRGRAAVRRDPPARRGPRDPAALPDHPAVRGGQAEHGRTAACSPSPRGCRSTSPRRSRRRWRGDERRRCGSAGGRGAPPPAASTSPTARARSPATTTPRRSRSGSSRTAPSSSPASASTTTSSPTSSAKPGYNAGDTLRLHPAVLQGVLRHRRGRRGVQRRAGAAGARGAQDAGRRERPHARLHHLDVLHAVPQGAVRDRRVPVRARALHGAEPGRVARCRRTRRRGCASGCRACCARPVIEIRGDDGRRGHAGDDLLAAPSEPGDAPGAASTPLFWHARMRPRSAS